MKLHVPRDYLFSPLPKEYEKYVTEYERCGPLITPTVAHIGHAPRVSLSTFHPEFPLPSPGPKAPTRSWNKWCFKREQWKQNISYLIALLMESKVIEYAHVDFYKRVTVDAHCRGYTISFQIEHQELLPKKFLGIPLLHGKKLVRYEVESAEKMLLRAVERR